MLKLLKIIRETAGIATCIHVWIFFGLMLKIVWMYDDNQCIEFRDLSPGGAQRSFIFLTKNRGVGSDHL